MLSKIVPLTMVLLGSGSAWAQSVISAHSGVIHYVEGQVSVDDKAVQPKFGQFPDVATGQTLATEDGRAEVLLTPGVFLRVAENSSFRMVSNQLSDTHVRILTGSALIEVAELLQDNAITLETGGANVVLTKKGLYRVDTGRGEIDPSTLRVYDGEARVSAASADADAKPAVVKRGRQVDLNLVAAGPLEAKNFDAKETDAFYRWGSRRSAYIADANLVSAKSAQTTMAYAGSGRSGWAWNPWFGMFTYLPTNGIYFSPFGSAYYSPGAFSYFFYPRFTAPAAVIGPAPGFSNPPMSLGRSGGFGGLRGSSAPSMGGGGIGSGPSSMGGARRGR